MNIQINDQVTYQKSKSERGNAVVVGLSCKKNHVYIKTDADQTLLVPLGELESRIMDNAQLLKSLIELTPKQIQQLGYSLGPCQASFNLMNALTELKNFDQEI